MTDLPVHHLPLFITAGLLLNLTPGPDMLYVAGTSAARGTRAGIAAALGIGAGCLVHVVLATVGLSAVLATSALAFTVVKWLGAAYLLWAGFGLLFKRSRPAAVETQHGRPVEAGPLRRVFAQGALINMLNPKVALFFLAFLPQFIDAGQPGQAWAFVLLGLLFDVGGTLVNGVVALFAGAMRARFAGRPGASRLGRWLERAVGGLFIGLGVKLALSTQR
jgi:threonine/homoserine/homoserine lactone efflux protein